jgi:hypothetical protein
MYIFAFAHTYKDKNYAASSGELTPKEIRRHDQFITLSLETLKSINDEFARTQGIIN